MKILISPDKFKGTRSAIQVSEAIRDGIQLDHQDWLVSLCPMSDGGEGTMDILVHHFNGHLLQVPTLDPWGNKILAFMGVSADKKVAMIDLSEASGMKHISSRTDVLQSSTLGTGILIRSALELGVDEILIGVGGSATNDAGIGAASALGYRFLNDQGDPLEPKSGNLSYVKYLDDTKIHPRIGKTKIIALCDVISPLYGAEGAARVYARQKGASPKQIDILEEGLINIAMVICDHLGKTIANEAGVGAGGGFGGGVVAFMEGTLVKGIEWIFELTRYEEKVKDSDIIITGEGRLDNQTHYGKVVSGIASIAKKCNKPMLIVAGENRLPLQSHLSRYPIFSLFEHGDQKEALEATSLAIKRMAANHIRPFIDRLSRQL